MFRRVLHASLVSLSCTPCETFHTNQNESPSFLSKAGSCLAPVSCFDYPAISRAASLQKMLSSVTLQPRLTAENTGVIAAADLHTGD